MASLPVRWLRVIAGLFVALGLGLLTIAALSIWPVAPAAQTPPPAASTAPAPTADPLVVALPPGAKTDPLGRLTAWPDKVEAPCPPPGPKTAVLLILGQSNAGNHGSPNPDRPNQAHALNWSQGHCYLASSPLLGATGQGGEPWTQVADQLLHSQQYTDVVIAPIAVMGAPISRWVPGGDIDQYLLQDVRALQSLYRTTHVVWQQGEADFAAGNTEERYRTSLLSVLKTLRSVGVRAPIYVSIATRCAAQPTWRADNAIAQAQSAVINAPEQILRGINLDTLLTAADRTDGCHLSAQGLRSVADAWAQLWIQP